MSQLPINPLSPEEQQRVMRQIYALMEKQVRSYHKHRHMGNHSSVPVELAQELMASITYTISLVGGGYAHRSVEEALESGQKLLAGRLAQAKSTWELVSVTAPRWQTECRWEALRYLRHYLETYDHLHLAHKGPDELFYPVLVAQPEGLRGIDSCIFYLNSLWIENQIMAAVPEAALEQFWDRLPTATLNQCEQLLINGIGKTLIGSGTGSLLITPEERPQLAAVFRDATEETLKNAANALGQQLALKDKNTSAYVQAPVPQLTHWLGPNTSPEALEHLFL